MAISYTISNDVASLSRPSAMFGLLKLAADSPRLAHAARWDQLDYL